jgi:ApaG protein
VDSKFSFIYHVSIKNNEYFPVQLISRHWIITDGDSKVKEVKGLGVIGKQPVISPGELYQYSSSVLINTKVGTMSGCYKMIDDSGIEFDATIPVFLLSVPGEIH